MYLLIERQSKLKFSSKGHRMAAVVNATPTISPVNIINVSIITNIMLLKTLLKMLLKMYN